MLAANWHGPRDVRLEQLAEPAQPTGEDVLVEVSWCGICGTDLHEYTAGPIFIPQGLDQVVLGHEFSGRVAAVGADVETVEVGDRVVVIPHRVCRECHFCRELMFQHCLNLELVGLTRNGAFARYTIARQDQLVALPEGIPDEFGALVEPLAVTLHGMRQPGVEVGGDIVIIGAGPIGLSAIATAKAVGLAPIYVVEMLPQRSSIARAMGADEVLNPADTDALAAIRELSGGAGTSVAMECVGLGQTMGLAIQAARPGGVALLAGITESASDVDLDAAVRDEKEIRGCIGYFDGEFEAVIDLLATGQLDPSPLITHRLELERIVDDGFEQLIRDRDACVKVLVAPS
jgi:(R,R)-butanediol dehydrogenase/meso-butanediol dehydrogenase/diacetyl reductase